MESLEHLHNLVQDITAPFGMGFLKIDDVRYALIVPEQNKEVGRVFWNEESKHFGIQFHTEVSPMDAIRIYNEAKTVNEQIHLYADYYTDGEHIYFGIDAHIMSEHTKEQNIVQAIEKQAQAKAEAEWQMKQIENRKITFH